jgi:hypothetical protein
MFLPCKKCRVRRESGHFYFDFENGNTFYRNSSDEIKQALQTMNQWCNKCKAAKFNLLCCSECLEFLSSGNFTQAEIDKGIDCKCMVCNGDNKKVFIPQAKPIDSAQSDFNLLTAFDSPNSSVSVGYQRPKTDRRCGACGQHNSKSLQCSRCINIYYCNTVFLFVSNSIFRVRLRVIFELVILTLLQTSSLP